LISPWLPAICVNTFGLAVLLIMLMDIGTRGKRFMLDDQRLFYWMLITNIIILVLDSGTWLLIGRTFPGARALNLAVTTTYYILDPVMSLLYLLFCDIKMGVPMKRRRALLPVYLIPIGINFVLSVMSIGGSYLFSIGADNRYSRGSLLALSFILSFLLMFVAFFRVLRFTRRVHWLDVMNDSRMSRNGVASLLAFAMPPLLGALVQVWFNQVTVVWISTILSLLIVHINIQNAEITTDALTGIPNRRQTDSYLMSLMQKRERAFTLIVMDLNHFKQINDQHGHLAGDNALKAMGIVLRDVCREDEFFSRYGGDEFVIVTQNSGAAYAEALVKKLNEGLMIFCRNNRLPFQLSLCAGYAFRDPETQTVDTIFTLADTRLYEQKSAMRRRSTDRS
jgi:diguanylate cyclase (GGDEF)-like protein